MSKARSFYLLLVLFSASIISNESNAQGASGGIHDLSFLIGTWEVEETILPGHPKSYKEIGTRTFSYYLDSSFIKLESKTTVSHSGKTREYAYFINYDKNLDCYWVTGIASDFPLHGKHVWYLDKEKREIRAITPQNVNGNQFFRGTISFKDKDQIEWNGWSSRFADDKEWKHIFRDVIKRVE